MTKRIIPEKDNVLKRFYRNHPLLTHFFAICLTAVLLFIVVFYTFEIFTRHGSTAVVPEVKGLNYYDAVEVIERADLHAEISDSVYINPDSVPPGTVIEVWPAEGAVVKPGREVFLVITSFSPGMVTVNSPLVNIASSQAQRILSRLHIDDVRIEYVPGEHSDEVLHALYQGREIHSGDQLPLNATVVLQVSSGPVAAPVIVEEPDSFDINDFLDHEVSVPQVVVPEIPATEPGNGPNPMFD